MSQAISVPLEPATAARTVEVAGWLGIELCGEARAVERVLAFAAPEVVVPVEARKPQARLRVIPAAPRAPRWGDRALTHSLVEWSAPAFGRAEMQTADATFSWNGSAGDVLDAELGLDPDDASAFQTALKLLSVLLGVVHRRRVLVHASAALLDGHALLFLGDSGAGKSTTAERLDAEGLARVADDAVFIEAADELRVFPYFGDRAFGGLGAPREGWPLGAALRLVKHAPVSRVAGSRARTLGTWLETLMVPAGPGAYAETLVDITAELAGCPVATLHAAESGPLRPALDGLLG